MEAEASVTPRPTTEQIFASYAEQANKYAKQVVSGRIPACLYVRQACQRHLDDLKASKKKRYPYEFNEYLAGKACFFIEQLHHKEGEYVGKPFKLLPWQVWIVCSVFGWVKRSDGYRRFRQAVIFVPSGNGKTPLAAAMALYATFADGEAGAQVYSVAVTREQAGLCWRFGRDMLALSPKLSSRMGAQQLAHAITHPASGSSFIALASEAKSLDGKNIHFAVVDEIHEHPTRDVYDKIHTFSKKRRQSLVLVISTAGSDTTGIGFEVWTDVVEMLSGERPQDSLFGVLYTIDQDDDWTAETAWKKANPNYGVSVQPDRVADTAKQATVSPQKQSSFKRYHLNVWTEAACPWISMDAWDRCADQNLKPEQFYEDSCVVGLDLALTTDICSIARVFVTFDDEGNRHYHVFTDNYLPEATIAASGNAQFKGWVLQGLLIAHEGEQVEHRTIEERLAEHGEKHRIQELVYDPMFAGAIPQNVEARLGALPVEFRQRSMEFTPAMQEFEAAVLGGRFHHDGNELLRWAVANVAVKPDSNNLIKPVKEHKMTHKKNDPAVATIMAIARAMHALPPDTGPMVWAM